MNAFKRTIFLAIAAMGAVAVLADGRLDGLPTWFSILGADHDGQVKEQGDQPEVSVLHGGDAWNGSTKRPGGMETGSDSSRSGQLTGLVTGVRDGDTILVGQVPVRIANLDCDERGSSRGDRAAQRMRSLALGQGVSWAPVL